MLIMYLEDRREVFLLDLSSFLLEQIKRSIAYQIIL